MACWRLAQPPNGIPESTTGKPGTFRLSPPAGHVGNWRLDYREMLGPMFFGETPTFEQMMAAAAEFEKTFNTTA